MTSQVHLYNGSKAYKETLARVMQSCRLSIHCCNDSVHICKARIPTGCPLFTGLEKSIVGIEFEDTRRHANDAAEHHGEKGFSQDVQA